MSSPPYRDEILRFIQVRLTSNNGRPVCIRLKQVRDWLGIPAKDHSFNNFATLRFKELEQENIVKSIGHGKYLTIQNSTTRPSIPT